MRGSMALGGAVCTTSDASQAPQPPGRHSYRWAGLWQRLESQTRGNTGRPWLRT